MTKKYVEAEVKVTEECCNAFKELGLTMKDIESVAVRIMEKVCRNCKPLYDIDSADNISYSGINLSWIRDNHKRTFLILTRREALELDSYTWA